MLATLLSSFALNTPAQAVSEAMPLQTIPFDGVQHTCKQVGEITFGEGGRWPVCHVTRGRWVATIDFLDLYQAQYCLGKTAGICEQTAQVIFANRAYTPDATVLIVRVDDGGTAYDDPMVVNSGDDSVMSVATHDAADIIAKRYYLWRTDHWITMKALAWQQDLSNFLPKGTSARAGEAFPDLETMSTQLKLFKPTDADCCPSGGTANVEFGLDKEQFAIKQVKIHPM
jgi:hypothetical protein